MQGLWKDKRKHFLKCKGKARNVIKDVRSKQSRFDFEYPFYVTNRIWFTAYPENQGLRLRAQKYASSMDRMKTKTFIQNKDWEANIKTHALSKSIAWEIH